MKKKKYLLKGMKWAADLLFPPRCPVCDEPVRLGEGLICISCREILEPVGEPACFRCGKPLSEEEQEYCGGCLKGRHLYIGGRALYRYESAARSIYRFKYGGRREYALFFGREMAKELEEFIRSAAPDGLVPVPIGRARFAERGYNQAQLLAEEIGKRLKIPVYDRLATRIRNTRPQKELNAHERQNNLKRAFKIGQNDVKLNTIIIVDDIYTTGSTVNALAEALLQSGVKRVYFVALAVGDGR